MSAGPVAPATTVSESGADRFALKKSGGAAAAGQYDNHPFHTGVVGATVAIGAWLVELVHKALACGELTRVEPTLAAGHGVGHRVIILPGDAGSGGDDERVGLKGLVNDGDGGLGYTSYIGGSFGRKIRRFWRTTGCQDQNQNNTQYRTTLRSMFHSFCA